MKLPAGEHAIIDRRKIVEYSLSTEHEDGQHKARLFASILGLTINDADQLIDALQSAAITQDAVIAKKDQYGQRYTIDFEFAGPSSRATIRSAWIIGPNESVPRLVTCYTL
jgi:hypothetical protein